MFTIETLLSLLPTQESGTAQRSYSVRGEARVSANVCHMCSVLFFQNASLAASTQGQGGILVEMLALISVA